MTTTADRDEKLKELEKSLGISFLNHSLFNQALTHSSYAYEMRHKDVLDNERLEFLGDAVIKLVISEYLYNKFPEKAEGDLTKIRASVISDRTLAAISRKLKLGTYFLLGMNEKKTGGRSRKSNLANALEALIGAIYLDAGIGKARDFLLENVTSEIDKVSREGYIRDYKSALQEFVQQHKWGLPLYRVFRETGPKHKKVFWIEVKVKGKKQGEGRGLNKKEAEQRAAFEALRSLKVHDKKEEKPKQIPRREKFRKPNEKPRQTKPATQSGGRKEAGSTELNNKEQGIGSLLGRVRRRFSR
ncbi:MAG: ribonuclease III [Candidatus Margulisbacteria bacterium]|nr:ribonuclease III [Candidatus Margulisiibacteriota bacterium]MBU1021928.1 ribonuclease III [Candidatus Margulisiibacteriota bacterium]MBU1728907.1 ribonuclease III [Candidatus Margulisiibacteriota bacterium]MBU1954713.1 ribonuclease III [Candidatus Margulisiibacteriota bacterium]